MLTFRILLLSVSLITGMQLWAQSGYEAMRSNDFVEAKKRFSDRLTKDSTDFEGLTGMIILSEIFQEYLPYEKFVNTLLRHHRNPHTFALYNFLYKGDLKSLEKLDYPDWVTVKYKLKDAIDWGDKNRDRVQLWEKYNAVVPRVKWSMIGPFRNINGSGFVTPHPVESDPFSPVKTYKNDNNVRLSWVAPLYTAGTGRIVFSQHLPDAGWSTDGIYYANTFIELDQDQTIQLQIGRTAPVKIWVNDILLYTNDHSVPYYYDIETLELRLKKGVNRIMIKNATYKSSGEGSGSLNFWDGNNYEHDMLTIRFTDVTGKPLTTLKSSFTAGSYNNDGLPIMTSVFTHSMVQYFKEQAEEKKTPWYDYCLMKAFLSENYTKDGEEYFYYRNQEKGQEVFYNYLFAKMCQFNGKSEKVYELLSKLDETKTPVFGLMYEKLQEINLDTDPDKYFIMLSRLAAVSPSNLNLMESFIDYYNKTGKQTEKDSFINRCIKAYPSYKEDLEDDLSTWKDKEERHGPEEQLKAQKQAIKELKTGSKEENFDLAIEYYKDKKKKDKVIATYKDKIYFTPHIVGTYYDFASYLNEVADYKQANEVLETSLKINPYQSNVYELLGDIARQEGRNGDALKYYEKGVSLGAGSGLFGLGSGLTGKIEQLKGTDNLKKHFKTPGFDEILQQEGWHATAENEDAIVLMYTKDAVLDTNHKVNMFQSFMVKILKESGIEKYNEIDMGFMGSITSAKVIKPDGTESTPEKSGSYLVIKNLESGDILQVESHDVFDAESIFGKEFFHQHFVFFPDPVYYSKLDMAVPGGKYLGYKAHKMDAEPKKSTDEFGYDHYLWENRNLTKLQEETAYPDYYDYYRSVLFSTMRNWQPVNDWYEQTTYKMTGMTYEVKQVLDTLIKPGMTDQEKVTRIYNFITTKIRYSYVPFLNSRFVPKWPGNTLSAGIGDCKDVATLMITMLRGLGIEAYYALVKTNQYNRLEYVPAMAFDHVIVCYVLNGTRSYCDLTTNFYPLYVLPEMDNDAMSLLIKPGEKEVSHLPNDMIFAEKTGARYEIEASFSGDRDLVLAVKAEYSGTAGGNLREMIFRTARNKYSEFSAQYFGQDVFENVKYDKVEFENLEDFSKPLKATYKITGKSFADRVSGLYILRMPYLEAIRKSQITNESDRSNRVDLEKILNVYPSTQVIHLKFPSGYKLAEVPVSINHSSKFCIYSVEFKPLPDGLQITKKQRFLKTLIPLEEFEEFKADYIQLLDLDKFKIALLKK